MSVQAVEAAKRNLTLSGSFLIIHFWMRYPEIIASIPDEKAMTVTVLWNLLILAGLNTFLIGPPYTRLIPDDAERSKVDAEIAPKI
jgi:hypothetical protein